MRNQATLAVTKGSIKTKQNQIFIPAGLSQQMTAEREKKGMQEMLITSIQSIPNTHTHTQGRAPLITANIFTITPTDAGRRG